MRMSRRTRAIACAAFVALLSLGTARAESPDGGNCTPDHDRAVDLMKLLSDTIRLTGPLQPKPNLSVIRTMVGDTMPRALLTIACDRPALSEKELAAAKALDARATKWLADETVLLDAEEKGREEIVVPLCQATWLVDNMRIAIAKERANPGGVVNLQLLHELGAAMQDAQATVTALRPQYQAFRHHAFGDWKTEGACVAASVPAPDTQ